MKTNKLIKIYFYVCELYNNELQWEVQRFSTNNDLGKITDEELITIYLYCIIEEEKFKIKSMHEHILSYWYSWFPNLPNYQNFNSRLNRLAPAFQLMVTLLMDKFQVTEDTIDVLIGDSMPIMTCSHKRKAKVARNIVDKGYCATKKLNYYGVKLHCLNLRNKGHLPLPKFIGITPASTHDLTALKPVIEASNITATVLDKAYCDKNLDDYLNTKQTILITPPKAVKGTPLVLKQFDYAFVKLLTTAIAKIRQPIESFFNWIHQITNIQNASKVRSENGLIVHVFGRLAASCFYLYFN
jgi:hypothetical protein